MTFYTCAIILTELMMLTMSIHVIPYSGFTREQKKWYEEQKKANSRKRR